MKNKMKLLVGYDGSACADAAIEDLINAGIPRETTAMILSAADVFLPQGREIKIPEPLKPSIHRARAAAKEQVKQAELISERACKKVQSLFQNWEVKYEACADSPAWALVKKADSWKANLIVVGAHGHTNIGRFLGSVSQMVLTQASCSVRVGRPIPRSGNKTLRVLIGIDGSPDSVATVKAVASRSWPLHAEFQLVSVIDQQKSSFVDRLAPSTIKWFMQQADDERIVIGRMIESFANKLREEGLLVTCKIKNGDPKQILVKEAEEWGANCIYVGARGLTHLKRFFVGGVSTAVAARAHCSVEVIRVQ